MNPLFSNGSNMIPNNNFMQNIKNMMNMFNASKDPQQVLNMLTSQNPMIKSIIEMSKNNGGDLEQLFKNMCQQQGVDPNTILNQLR